MGRLVTLLRILERLPRQALKHLLHSLPTVQLRTRPTSYRSCSRSVPIARSAPNSALHQSYAQRRIAGKDIANVAGVLLVHVVHDQTERFASEGKGGLFGGRGAREEVEGL